MFGFIDIFFILLFLVKFFSLLLVLVFIISFELLLNKYKIFINGYMELLVFFILMLMLYSVLFKIEFGVGVCELFILIDELLIVILL